MGVQDSEEFERLTAPFRAELQAYCYRMLGSVHDAEDQVQETLLRAWRGYDGFEGRSSVRTWLYRIATNACLRALETRDRRPDGSYHAHGICVLTLAGPRVARIASFNDPGLFPAFGFASRLAAGQREPVLCGG